MKKALLYFGILSPIFWTAAVVVGGFLWPEYSHLRQPVSELSADFAPKMPTVQLLFFLANLSGLLFGIGVLTSTKISRFLGWLLVATGIVSLLFYFFPQDPIGSALTVKGLVHLILAGASSLLTIAIVFTAWRVYRPLKTFSLIMGIIIVLSGLLTVYATTQLPDIFGLIERTTIGAYMVWLFVFALSCIQNKELKNAQQS